MMACTYWSNETSTAATTAWNHWVMEYDTGTGGCATTIWRAWSSTDSAMSDTIPRQRTETAAERAARERREREQREMAERLQREQDAAHARAEALLLAHLTDEQRADYREFGCFNVISMSGRAYRIRKAKNANVDLLNENGRVQKRLCAFPQNVPVPDQMLAQKLLLESDGEQHFLSKVIEHHACEPTHAVPPLRRAA